MFSRINAMLGPNSQGDRREAVTPEGRGRRQDSRSPAGDAEADDLVLLSTGAVRAMVQEEKSLAAVAPELLRLLAVIEQHGLQNLPVRAGQPVADAIREAASFFASVR
ncbi:MAG TPA: hypothetical protein VEF76_12570 [Patescibacteria group bacterium]|nr:hypothetical protein [Patescibacteria group bacterium]